MHPKIGFCCKYVHHDRTLPRKQILEIEKRYNTGTTTLSWLNRQSRQVAEKTLSDLAIDNSKRTLNLVKYVATLPDSLRMVRISSDQLPMYTHAVWGPIYQSSGIMTEIESIWSQIGLHARTHDVRLSFHPGQFCCLASESKDVIDNSIAELEYHAMLAQFMGYGKTFHDHGFKINIHISGRAGLAAMRSSIGRLSDTARNLLTLENDEYSYGLSDCLSLSDIVPVVLDIHHNFIREGDYIDVSSDLTKKVIESWRGVRPVIHYSVSCQRYSILLVEDELPCLKDLLDSGVSKQKLRAHSDDYWNSATNDWAFTFLPHFDIMCESKLKNLASSKLYDHFQSIDLKI